MGINCTVELEFQSCPCPEDLHLVFESSFQSAGSQVDDLLLQQKTPNLCGGLVRSFGDCLKFALKLLGFVYQFVETKLRAQLNSGQELEHAVVQLSGETPALFLNGGRGNCTLQSGPAIPFVFQVGLKSPPGIITSSYPSVSIAPAIHAPASAPALPIVRPASRGGAPEIPTFVAKRPHRQDDDSSLCCCP